MTTITIKALRANGNCYRSWHAPVVYANERGVVTETPPGNTIWDIKAPWQGSNHIRAFYWFDRPYNLLEVFNPDGTLAELYVHVASPARLEGDVLSYIDYELDVVQAPDGEPFIADEEEFAHAITLYGYNETFQQECRAICNAALALITRWPVGIAPQEGIEQA